MHKDRQLIQLTDVCRHYHHGHSTVKAVDGVSLAIAAGEFVGIVGSSGSGKSTILNLIAGLDSPTSGRITYSGTALADMTPGRLAGYRARQVGMVFQSFNLLPHRTALGNVELALLFDGTPRAERRGRAASALSELGLGDRLDHRPADLSGGEQQRVAIARALVKKPEILLADEPSGNLDRQNTKQITDLLARLNDQGLTIVMVTHDLDLAGRFARRIVRMHYGKIADPDGCRSAGGVA
ncbi:MAG: ABC transporter ATP-binding protein [bacterium]